MKIAVAGTHSTGKTTFLTRLRHLLQVTRNFVSAIERGAQGLDVIRLRRLSGALGIDFAVLVSTDHDGWTL